MNIYINKCLQNVELELKLKCIEAKLDKIIKDLEKHICKKEEK